MKLNTFKLLLAGMAMFPGYGLAAGSAEWDTYADTWVAEDDLGRRVFDETGTPDALAAKKTDIGMFYYLWHGMHNTPGHSHIYDVTEILKANPENPAFGPWGVYHYWGHPLLDYYKAGDPFAVYKHMQMLCDAGVDFLFFDCTNGVTYDSAVEAVMREIDRRESLGLRVPKLSFMVHFGALATAERIYKTYYQNPKNDKYWYMYDGKPLLLGNPKEIGATKVEGLMDRFTFRDSWAWMQGKKPGGWPWLEYAPQAPGWTKDKSTPEQLSVSVAQHATTKVGKSYHNGKQPPLNRYGVTDSTAYGLYFEEQWKEAHRLHTPVLMLTQFNEWIAMRLRVHPEHLGETRPGAKESAGESRFVDTYNGEFNRDVEPSTHPLIRDNYYLQLCSHIRQYRGVRRGDSEKIAGKPVVAKMKVNGNLSQWAALKGEFRDDRGDVMHRNFINASGEKTLTNTSGRNDFLRSKVAEDKKNIYFYVQVAGGLSPLEAGGQWVSLLVNADGDYKTGWYGYDYLVATDADGRLALSAYADKSWRKTGNVKFKVSGAELQLAVSKKMMPADGHIDFKWVDNVDVRSTADVLDFYVDGDAAPNGRFNYRYHCAGK